MKEQIKKRGRPTTGKAKSNAIRMKEYRQRLKESGVSKQSDKQNSVVADLQQENRQLKEKLAYLQIQLDVMQSQHTKPEKTDQYYLDRIEVLTKSNTALKAESTKYRNALQKANDRINHLEFMASQSKSVK